jgi:glycosyltransferase involved in cell wall biosynthesis
MLEQGEAAHDVVATFFENWGDASIGCFGVSVVVCTYRRPSSIIDFLESLEQFESDRHPVLVIDASPDEQTELTLRRWYAESRNTRPLAYVRVGIRSRGLTRQRNFALRLVPTDLVCFFDDDIKLMSDCVTEMERAFRHARGKLAGIAALIVNQPRKPTSLWRLRRALGMIAHLRPGTYHGSGLSVPWGYVPDSDQIVIGDWIPGGCALWNTARARVVGFCEDFSTYSQAEDLEFSTRMREEGELAVATGARVVHLHETGGREQQFRLGYMAIRNRFHIHKQRFRKHRLLYTLWFTYAWSLDTVMLGRHVIMPRRTLETLGHIAGRLAATFDLLVGKPDRLLLVNLSKHA